MPKQEHKILEFHGGTNNKFDSRDIADNQNAQSSLSIRKPGRLAMEGSFKNLYGKTGLSGKTINDVTGTLSFKAGYGLFTFSHDYDMDSTPDEVDTDFIITNDSVDIDIYDPGKSGGAGWRDAQFTLGSRTTTVKPNYYNVDGALRVCDSNFIETDLGIDTEAAIDKTDVIIHTESGTIAIGSIIKINQEIMYVTSGSSSGIAITVIRGFANTRIASHLTNQDIYYVNIPRYFGHIKQDRFFEASTSDSINEWVLDVQGPQPPNDTRTTGLSSPYLASSGTQALRIYDLIEGPTSGFPTEGEKVVVEFGVTSPEVGIIEVAASGNVVTITTSGFGNSSTESHGLAMGDEIVISNTHSTLLSIRGTHEVTAVIDNTNFTIEIEDYDTSEILDWNEAANVTDIASWADYSATIPDTLAVTVNASEIVVGNTVGGNIWIHITGQAGVDGFNGVYNATRINDTSCYFKHPLHEDHGTGDGSGTVQQLIGTIAKVEGKAIHEDLKRKWNFAMSFTYDGPGVEVQESLLTQGYKITPMLTEAGAANRLAADLEDWAGSEHEDEVVVDDGDGAISAGDVILLNNQEQLYVTSVSSNTLTITQRQNSGADNNEAQLGYKGSLRQAHADNTQIYKIEELTPTATVDWTAQTTAPNTVIKFLYNKGASFDSNASLGGESIQLVKDRDFSAASSWVEYSPDGAAPAFTDDGSGQLEITGTTSTNREGAKIDAVNLHDLRQGGTYRISAKIWWDTGAVDGDIFYFRIGDTVSAAFEVTGVSKSVTYYKDILVTDKNVDSVCNDAYIYKAGSTDTEFYIDDVSIKEVISPIWNPRINGFKIYMKDVTEGDSSKEWRLFSQVNFNKGTYNMFAAHDSEIILEQPGTWANDYKVSTVSDGTQLNIKPVDTYLSENLFTEETIIDASYKTSAIVGRRVYIGNIRQGGRSYPDRMIRTPVNKFDTFPETNYIDVAIGDGDSITKLMSFGDRLLQFKKDKVYIINVGGDSEILESEYQNAGITYPTQVCKTNDGIAWINDSGLWLFDGDKIENLTRHIEADGYTIGTGTADIPTIGFDKKSNRVIYTLDIVNGAGTQWYIYDMELKAYQSYHKGIVPFSGSSVNYYTNMMNDVDGELLIGYADGSATEKGELNIFNWTNTSRGDESHAGDYFLSKDIDFGSPAIRKKIYKVYITYKCTGHSGIKVEYATDGGTSFSGFSTSTSTNYSIGALEHTNGAWAVAELKPSSSINNVKSIQLKLTNEDGLAVHSSGTCNDVTGASNSSFRLNTSSASGTADVYVNYVIGTTGGAARYNVGRITAYNNTTKAVTLGDANTVDYGYGDTSAIDGAGGDATTYKIGVVPSDFEINDITIIYRMKPVK